VLVLRLVLVFVLVLDQPPITGRRPSRIASKSTSTREESVECAPADSGHTHQSPP